MTEGELRLSLCCFGKQILISRMRNFNEFYIFQKIKTQIDYLGKDCAGHNPQQAVCLTSPVIFRIM